MGVIGVNDPNNFLWLDVGDKIIINNVPGDLIYGKLDGHPVAIDKYSGKVEWKSKASNFANVIRVGNSWVVYSTLKGNLQCFKMKNEIYCSPNRPAS